MGIIFKECSFWAIGSVTPTKFFTNVFYPVVLFQRNICKSSLMERDFLGGGYPFSINIIPSDDTSFMDQLADQFRL